MPKLVIKQEIPPVVKTKRWVDRVQTMVIAMLGVIVCIALWAWWNANPRTDIKQEIILPAPYQTLSLQFSSAVAQFQQINQSLPENYEKHARLVVQAQAVLQHLTAMDTLLPTLSLSDVDKQTLETRNGYQKDEWAATVHFHQLRMERFKAAAQPMPETSKPAEETAIMPPTLPAGLCPITGPDAGKCKP